MASIPEKHFEIWRYDGKTLYSETFSSEERARDCGFVKEDGVYSGYLFPSVSRIKLIEVSREGVGKILETRINPQYSQKFAEKGQNEN